MKGLKTTITCSLKQVSRSTYVMESILGGNGVPAGIKSVLILSLMAMALSVMAQDYVNPQEWRVAQILSYERAKVSILKTLPSTVRSFFRCGVPRLETLQRLYLFCT
ncbi:MAG: hypothetical protein IJK42_06400 [Prevotella sp.]|nr:hypothetical protein [Prevotella sp.]MBQ6209385.1 hypothetical protein [Prevotella sp.]